MQNSRSKIKPKVAINVDYTSIRKPHQTEARAQEYEESSPNTSVVQDNNDDDNAGHASSKPVRTAITEEANKYDGTEEFKPGDLGCEVEYIGTKDHHYERQKSSEKDFRRAETLKEGGLQINVSRMSSAARKNGDSSEIIHSGLDIKP